MVRSAESRGCLSSHRSHTAVGTLTWCPHGQSPSPTMMSTFCQVLCRCCLWFSSVRQLGDLDASLPAMCSPCTRSGELLILSVNWISCPVSTVKIETRSCEFQLVKIPKFSGLWHPSFSCVLSDMGTPPLTGQTGESLMAGSLLLSCWCTRLINAARNAVRGISKQIPGTKQSNQLPAGGKQTESRASPYPVLFIAELCFLQINLRLWSMSNAQAPGWAFALHQRHFHAVLSAQLGAESLYHWVYSLLELSLSPFCIPHSCVVSEGTVVQWVWFFATVSWSCTPRFMGVQNTVHGAVISRMMA